MSKLVILDSFALIFRAYYAYPPTLTTKEGIQINAVYGFTNILLDILKKLVVLKNLQLCFHSL